MNQNDIYVRTEVRKIESKFETNLVNKIEEIKGRYLGEVESYLELVSSIEPYSPRYEVENYRMALEVLVERNNNIVNDYQGFREEIIKALEDVAFDTITKLNSLAQACRVRNQHQLAQTVRFKISHISGRLVFYANEGIVKPFTATFEQAQSLLVEYIHSLPNENSTEIAQEEVLEVKKYVQISSQDNQQSIIRKLEKVGFVNTGKGKGSHIVLKRGTDTILISNKCSKGVGLRNALNKKLKNFEELAQN